MESGQFAPHIVLAYKRGGLQRDFLVVAVVSESYKCGTKPPVLSLTIAAADLSCMECV